LQKSCPADKTSEKGYFSKKASIVPDETSPHFHCLIDLALMETQAQLNVTQRLDDA
jgi:hypothetical protein